MSAHMVVLSITETRLEKLQTCSAILKKKEYAQTGDRAKGKAAVWLDCS